MSKVSIAGDSSGTGTFTIKSPNSNSDRTLTLPDASGTILTTATPGVPVNGPAFSAYLGLSTQTISTSTWTKIAVNTEEFDTNSNYDTSNYRFTPTVAGYYQFSGSIEWSPSSQTAVAMLMFSKNGSLLARGTGCPFGSIGPVSSGAALIYCNGSSDYVEMYAYQNTGSNINVNGNNVFATKFSGALVRAA